ncbi:hypothetical protein WL222_13110, partial [Staphylococcus caprae]
RKRKTHMKKITKVCVATTIAFSTLLGASVTGALVQQPLPTQQRHHITTMMVMRVKMLHSYYINILKMRLKLKMLNLMALKLNRQHLINRY